MNGVIVCDVGLRRTATIFRNNLNENVRGQIVNENVCGQIVNENVRGQIVNKSVRVQIVNKNADRL